MGKKRVKCPFCNKVKPKGEARLRQHIKAKHPDKYDDWMGETDPKNKAVKDDVKKPKKKGQKKKKKQDPKPKPKQAPENPPEAATETEGETIPPAPEGEKDLIEEGIDALQNLFEEGDSEEGGGSEGEKEGGDSGILLIILAGLLIAGGIGLFIWWNYSKNKPEAPKRDPALHVQQQAALPPASGGGDREVMPDEHLK